jgi:K+-sensing histidine kinase KdpD
MAADPSFTQPNTNVKQLQAQVLELEHQLTRQTAKNRAMWTLLVEVTRRLHASSASIKAAVSSLLDYDIFWDGSAQHEFLETIDDSVDQGSSLITLMTLAFRSEANDLDMNLANQSLQEIVATVLDTIFSKIPQAQLNVEISPEGPAIFVDYGHLAVALRFLLEIIVESPQVNTPITVQAVEAASCWQLDITPAPGVVVDFIQNLTEVTPQNLMQPAGLPPESVLKLFTTWQLFKQQHITLHFFTTNKPETGLRVVIPFSQISQSSLL